MDHLTAIEKVREIITEYGDEFTTRRWERRVRRSDNPQAVIDNLKKAVETANEFWEWSSTIPGIDQGCRLKEYKFLLFWGGSVRGVLEDAKKDFSRHC